MPKSDVEYWITAKDGVLRMCPTCKTVHTVYVQRVGTRVLLCCTVCSLVLQSNADEAT